MEKLNDIDLNSGIASSMFSEPDGYFKKDKTPYFVSYKLLCGDTINLRLLGQSPLWGHLLWNAGKVAAKFFETNWQTYAHEKCILELGAGAGLPGLICAINNASLVVLSDYPDPDLLDNLRMNVESFKKLTKSGQVNTKFNVNVQKYIWGSDVSDLLSLVPRAYGEGYDVIILSDLIFNHSEHEKLIFTLKSCLSKSTESRVLVFFTPHRPWLVEKDLNFFALARQSGFDVVRLSEEIMPEAMFENDNGCETLRRTVFTYEMKLSQV